MKKIIALLLAIFMIFTLFACSKKESEPADADKQPEEADEKEVEADDETPDTPDEEVEPDKTDDEVVEGVEAFDWTEFDNLIAEIRVNTDLADREAQMHKAEDMLMETGAICPLYYYNDAYMIKDEVKGFYGNLFGHKYFQFAELGDNSVMRLCLASEPDKLDPALNTTMDGGVLCVNSFSGLMTHNPEGEKVPDLAEKVEVSEDNLTYTFTIRDGLKWSDGKPLDAKDFEASWKRAAAEETAADYGYLYEIVKGYPNDLAAKASEDGKTFTVELEAPCPYFYDLCAFPTFFPVPMEEVENAEGYMKDGKIENPGAWALEAGFVSNGAYNLVEWKHKESMVYQKNPNYHRADEVKIERLEFMLSDDSAVIYNAYRDGSLDFIDSVPTDEVKTLLETQDPEFKVVDQLGTYFVIFNVKSDLFAGKTVQEARDMRHALSYMIDREYIVDTVAQTGQKIATSFIPAGMFDGQGTDPFKQSDEDYQYPFPEISGYFPEEPDLEKAKELFISAGYEFDGDKLSDATPLHIKYITNKSDAHSAIAECMQSDFAQFGITMEIAQMDWDTTMAERRAGNYDVARHGWIADFNDPINMLEMWMTDSGNNDAQFGRFDD
ncbi:MAG TPA: peptide ABC transporter substrate-binding protein [Clostridiaceae bacterium]|nr:peptide ABC transporter substrate-binding protein [Clostridiaceae bacterium]